MNKFKIGLMVALAVFSLNASANNSGKGDKNERDGKYSTSHDGCAVCDPDNSIFGSDFKDGKSTQTFKNFIPDTDATFTAVGGKFEKKTQAGYTGVGISGKTSGEIDIGERIDVSFTKNIIITNITLGLLFDGPEYGDVNEKAKITATFLDGTKQDYFLTAVGIKTADWTGPGSVTNLSPATDKGAALWAIANPFGNKQVSALSFTAVAGLCGSGKCNNQSDYVLHCISAVPEPSTYAMMMAGIAAVGFSARRKANKQA
ncbi:putative secreted protein with PEP-CTERM sorting signal [Methylovorus glucosotrophus]|uniref:PEP-CTERM sorting domain-containing protein n=1 Tax=Methylovorus glucosotrophus TaxID=266009 RepID=UPI0013319BCC|nr:PEP-CTERM sorting domain-containing protein [Methylovorus glucosotrophus]KAF0844310.1 putative secreted protein with PEP-CTERM sorting signal [Methylovorus glucosotrophus]